jgi:mannose-1-phosphate guanylyltransferase
MNPMEMDNKENIIAIILTGKRDFGRCPIASSVPVALWPVMGKTALQGLLDSLARQSVSQAIICSYGDSDLLRQEFVAYRKMTLTFLEEEFPLGTAGCIRYAASKASDLFDIKDKHFLVFNGSMVSPPDIDLLLETHLQKKSILSVGLNPPNTKSASQKDIAGVYVCDPDILNFIPNDGYCDIKETLIPTLLQADKKIESVNFPSAVGNFREKDSYLLAITEQMARLAASCNSELDGLSPSSNGVWIDPSAQVDSSATILGPVAILEKARIEKGAVISGPTVINPRVHVGKNTLVNQSVLWPEVRVSDHCEIQRCLIDKKVVIHRNLVIEDQAVAFGKKRLFQRTSDLFVSYQLCLAALLLVAFFYSYWPQITDLFSIWMRSDEYGCGALVPLIAIAVLWMRRDRFKNFPMKPAIFWATAVLLLIQLIRFYGLYVWLQSVERYSLVMTIFALVLMVYGWKFLRRALPVLLFLFLMIPLPNRVQFAITQPLQSWATHSAVYSLEVLDYDVIRQGNIIRLRSSSDIN